MLIVPNKTSVDLENMPDCEVPSRNGPAGGPEGARRRDALLHVPGARGLHRGADRAPSSPTGSACTPTPCACTSSGCARPVSSTSSPCTAARSAGPSTSTRSRRARPASGSTRRATRCSPGCSPRSPSGSAPRPTTRPPSGRAWGVEAGRRTRSKSCVKALFGEMDRLGLRARARDLPGGGADIAFLHCPFRELAEAYPELVCNLHRGICEGVVDDGRRGKSRGVRDVVRPRPVPGHRFRRSILNPSAPRMCSRRPR